VVGGIAGYYADVRPPGGADIDSSLVGKHNGSNFAAYLQLEKKFFNKLTVGFGVRYEYFRIDTFTSDALPVFRAGLNYQAAEATFIRASWGQGYRFPTIAEKFVNTSVGGIGIFPNPNLEPETGWSAEIGVKQGVKLGEWLGYVDLAGFINQYNNMMEFTFGPFGSEATEENLFGLGFSSQNIGNTRILGGEITLIGQGNIGKFPIQILGGYTYIDPKSLNKDDKLELYNQAGDILTEETVANPNQWAFYQGTIRDGQLSYAGTSSSEQNILKYRFRHTIKLDAQIGVKKFEFGVSVQYTSFMENIDYIFVSDIIVALQPLLNTSAFSGLREFREQNERGNTQLDFRIAYNVSPKIKLSVICKNALNQDQMERPAYMAQPRNYTAQISMEF
jgi:iron complex outermembrane receptor protein